MESRDYSSWSLGLKQRVAGRRVPLAGTIELTRRCNQACRHCYNNLPAADARELGAELGTDEWVRILNEAAAAGCVWLLFTGGEILLRTDFREIYLHAKQKGFLVTLFTNGTLIDAALADFLAVQRPLAIEITLYGATGETYERVTGRPGSFGQCLSGIRRLRERGLPLKLKSTVSALNRHDVQAMRRLAQDQLGLPFRFDALLNARCDGSRRPLDVRLGPEAVVRLDLADPERAAALRELARRAPSRDDATDAGRLYPCGGGRYSFAVDPYGRLRPCAISPAGGFGLKGGRFQEGWDSFLAETAARRADRETKCRRCRLRDLCGTCPAAAELECGDSQQPVDFLCRVAHLRAQALGLAVAAHGDCEYCRAAAAGGAGHFLQEA